jgi:hypothetical protein
MNKFKAIAIGGLAAGALDIVYAFIVYGPLTFDLSPMQVLQSVAGGWIGREAANAGGWNTAALGALTHFLIALTMADVFVTLAPPAAKARPILSGTLYGLVLYVVMNYVVVPLSAARTGHFPADVAEATARLAESFGALRPKEPLMLLGTVFTHTVLVGVPIALANRRFNP